MGKQKGAISMNRMLKRSLHLGALVAGLIAICAGRGSAVTGTPISSCTSVGPGNFYLSQNITASTSEICIIVTGNTTIDLNNKTLSNSFAGLGLAIGDNDSAAPNVIIANGTISHFEDGVYMENSSSDT